MRIEIYTHAHTLWNIPVEMKKTDSVWEKELLKAESLSTNEMLESNALSQVPSLEYGSQPIHCNMRKDKTYMYRYSWIGRHINRSIWKFSNFCINEKHD